MGPEEWLGKSGKSSTLAEYIADVETGKLLCCDFMKINIFPKCPKKTGMCM